MLIARGMVVVTVYDHEENYQELRQWWIEHAEVHPIAIDGLAAGFIVCTIPEIYALFDAEFPDVEDN